MLLRDATLTDIGAELCRRADVAPGDVTALTWSHVADERTSSVLVLTLLPDSYGPWQQTFVLTLLPDSYGPWQQTVVLR